MFQHLGQCGSKVILSLVSKAGGNTKTITIHLREALYRMVIVCNICWSFASMNTQGILGHHSGCKAQQDKEHANQEGQETQKSCTRKNQNPRDERRHSSYPAQRSPHNHKEQNATQHLLSSPAGGHKLIHFLNLSGSSWLHCSGEFSLSQANCHLFLQSQCS